MGHHRPYPTSLRYRAVDAARPIAFVAMVVSAALLTGCAASSHADLVSFLRAHEDAVGTGQYTVMPPDTITVHSPTAPEVDGVTARLRPDGKIVLRLLGEVDVAGLTTEQVAEKLRQQLARYYVDPEVVVNVSSYKSQFYYVFGEGVGAAGRRPFTGRVTLLGALADAGLNNLAWRSHIRVVRPSANEEERKTIIVDLDRMVRSGEVDQNFLLQPGDIIEVPPTPLAWTGLRVRELLYPVGPVVNAYAAPIRPIDATRTYEDEFGGDDSE
ncbi:MAG: polysaccharide biosynthesis/export family protein [Phycisphaerae bacterium]|jgi:polysaccharide export outer membrane protein